MKGSRSLATGCVVVLGACLAPPADVDFDAGVDANDVSPPTIVSLSPESGSSDAPTDGVVVVTFSESMDPATVTDATLVVEGPGGSLAGTRVVAGDTVTFTSAARLTTQAAYTVSFDSAIADVAGNTLGGDVDAEFVTRAGAWSEPSPVEEELGASVRSGSHVIAVSRNGSCAAIAWISRTCPTTDCQGDYRLWAAVYRDGAFGDPQLVTDAAAQALEFMDLVVDDEGNSLLAFTQRTGTYSSLYSSRRSADQAWSSPAPMESENLGNVGMVDLDIDDEGAVMAVWVQENGATSNAWWSRYTTSWSGAALLENSADNVAQVALVMEADGRGLVAWATTGGSPDARYARFDGATWTSADLANGFAGELSLSVGANGAAYAVWVGADKIVGSRYNGNWSPVADVSASEFGDFVMGPTAAAFADGSGLAVWAQGTGLGTLHVLSSRYDGSWSAPDVVDTSASQSLDPRLAAGAPGYAVSAWKAASDGVSAAWFAYHAGGAGWQEPGVIATAVNSPKVAYVSRDARYLCAFTEGVNGRERLRWTVFE